MKMANHTMQRVTLLILCVIGLGYFAPERVQADPPYSGTIFVDPDIIVASDPTTFKSVVGAGQGNRWMFDRRANAWVYLNAFLFNASYSDGLGIEIQVNPEFGDQATALAEAAKYAPVIGRLPTCLRTGVQTVWIHKGTQPFGGGNNNLLIHTGQADQYAASGILEETLVHEATHTSLDAAQAGAPGWIAAQAADNEFISTYARDYPDREDLAESFLLYLALRHRSDRISLSVSNTIARTIPHRIAYLDGLGLDMNPVVPRTPPRVTGFTYDSAAGTVSLTWTTRSNAHYAVDISTNLIVWEGLVSNVASAGASASLVCSNSLPRARAFFVVRELTQP